MLKAPRISCGPVMGAAKFSVCLNEEQVTSYMWPLTVKMAALV